MSQLTRRVEAWLQLLMLPVDSPPLGMMMVLLSPVVIMVWKIRIYFTVPEYP